MARKKKKNGSVKKDVFTPIPRERALVPREDTFALQKAMTALATLEKPEPQKNGKQRRKRHGLGWLIAAALVFGLIAAGVFHHFHHIRNYKACKKGAIAGLITLAVIILFFALMLVFALL